MDNRSTLNRIPHIPVPEDADGGKKSGEERGGIENHPRVASVNCRKGRNGDERE
jgi:hypothetical protein